MEHLVNVINSREILKASAFLLFWLKCEGFVWRVVALAERGQGLWLEIGCDNTGAG